LHPSFSPQKKSTQFFAGTVDYFVGRSRYRGEKQRIP